MIVVRGNRKYSKLILEYFKGALNSWNFDSDDLFYGVDHGIVMAYFRRELPQDVTILTYKDLEEL